jgi:AraC-like DNA-binding protein
MPTQSPLAMTYTSNDKGTVAISLVNEAIDRALARGVDLEPIMALSGITPAMLAQPRSRVSARQFGVLWSEIARRMDDEFFGQDSHPMRWGSFVIMTHAALTAHSGRQALARAVGFMRLVLDDLAVQVEEDPRRVRLLFVNREGTPVPPLFTFATWFVMVYGLVCWLVGRRIPIIAARFRCPEPRDLQEYRLIFCDDLTFGQDDSYVDLAPEFLQLPVVQTPDSVKSFLRDAPGSFIVKYRNRDALAARVRRVLRDMPAANWPTSDAMARKLNMASATLRRRLKQEGYTYQSIKDDLRRDIAIGLLQEARLSMADIAVALGFAEPSAFHRAFRKWTGLRPSDYRRTRDAA